MAVQDRGWSGVLIEDQGDIATEGLTEADLNQLAERHGRGASWLKLGEFGLVQGPDPQPDLGLLIPHTLAQDGAHAQNAAGSPQA